MAETPNGNGNGLMKYARVVSQLGVPVVLSLFLVYWITSFVSNDVLEGAKDRRFMIELLRDQNRQMDANLQHYGTMLRMICLNTAATDYGRSVCNEQQPGAPRVEPTRQPTPPPEPNR